MSGRAEAGRSIGRWRLIERLGAGGMGEVWHAADGEGRTAALKLLRGAGLEPELARRFAREAETLAALDHPNVVRALDHGQADGGGLLFVAMELLQGQSLDARLRAGPLAVGEAVRVARAAAAGLGAAHAHGLVHRDVKPGNLFLCGDGDVKVLDFGIALEVDAEATRLTQTGALMGTPSYMAPEQATGEGRIDERTDVWGLGAVMHRALSGQRPFWAGGNALAEMLRIVRDEPLPLPAHVPAAVAAVVRRALQKDPAQRFATMRDFAAALALDDGALAAAPAAATAQAASALHVDARTGASAGPYADTDTETSARTTPVSLRDEVRLVTALLAEGVRDRAAADALSYLVEGLGGAGTELAGGRFVGVFGGAEWAGDEPARAVRAALAARAHARWIAVGTGKALRVEGEATLVTGAALFAAEAVVRRLESSGAEGLVGACPETRRRGGFGGGVPGDAAARGAGVRGERRRRGTGGARRTAPRRRGRARGRHGASPGARLGAAPFGGARRAHVRRRPRGSGARGRPAGHRQEPPAGRGASPSGHGGEWRTLAGGTRRIHARLLLSRDDRRSAARLCGPARGLAPGAGARADRGARR